MRILIQRVREARVTVSGRTAGAIGVGLLALVGFSREDGPELPGSPAWERALGRLCEMRIFPDPEDRMKLSLTEWGGELLLVPQFTLYADLGKGRRPSFHLAAEPEVAEPLFARLVDDMRVRLPGKVAQGEFGASMHVSLVNWGPVTIMLDSVAGD
jgi:D-tyrosyl-tRNA(Tyr) deacylase